jgi:Uma2 family endonuclease
VVWTPEPNQKYTYADYLTWSDDERWELIDGVAYHMTPAPSPEHQDISRELLTEFNNYLRGKTCKVYPAPFDVRLFPNEKKDDNDVVQPDLTIVCNPDFITKLGCEGVPELVIEILSPSTAKKDKGEKKRLYQRAGVKEYWIVDPLYKTVEVFVLDENGRYGEAELYGSEDEIEVRRFEGLTIHLKDIFG